MRLILTELKYSFLTLMLFSLVLIIMTPMITSPNGLLSFRLNPIIFVLGVLLYNLLYRKEEKSERFLVTLPVNIRLIPLLRYITPFSFWIFSQVLFYTVAGSLGLQINLLSEMLISFKVTGILLILMSATFIFIDKFLEYGSRQTLKILSFPLILTLLTVLIIFFSLLPTNVINKTDLKGFIFVKETVMIFWTSELSLVLISLVSVLSVILNIELHANKKVYLN